MFGGKGSKKRRKKNEGNRSTFHGKLVASKLDGTNKRIKHISKRVFFYFMMLGSISHSSYCLFHSFKTRLGPAS